MNPVTEQEGISTDIKRFRAPFYGLEGRRDILAAPDLVSRDFKAERAGCYLGLSHFQHRARTASVGHDRQPAETGQSLAKKFETLGSKINRLKREAGDVSARPRKACNKPVSNRVRRRRENNWYGRCRLLCRDDW